MRLMMTTTRFLPWLPVLTLLVLAMVVMAGDTATIPIDAATIAALIWGLISPFLLHFVPRTGNVMLLVTWGSTFVVAAGAVLLVNGWPGLVSSKLLIDLMIAYSIQAGLYSGAKQNWPQVV